MTPRKPKAQSLTEADILHAKDEDLDRAFIELFKLYSNQIYSYCYSTLFYHTHLTEDTTQYVFWKAYKYFHAFVPGQVTYRSYLFSLAYSQARRHRTKFTKTQRQVPQTLRKKLSADQLHLWQALQHLDFDSLTVIELWHGPHLSSYEIGLVLNKEFTQIEEIYTSVLKRLQHSMEDPEQALQKLFSSRSSVASLSSSKLTRMNREVMGGKSSSPTFVRRSWWRSFLGPIPLGFVISIIAVVSVATWYVNAPQPIVTEVVEETKPIIRPILDQRPQALLNSGALPDIQKTKESLTEAEGRLYGTNYVKDTLTESGSGEEVRPDIDVNIITEDYRAITETFTYTVPEALTKEQLQLAAFRHFFSLPLNDFTYVNGTYYIEDSDTDFKPLFVSFNNDGRVDYQMRQAAICDLENLTDQYDEDDIREIGYDFLRSHNFVEVEEDELRAIRISSDGQRIKKDAVCKDGSQDSIQDWQFVYYPVHTLLRYGDSAEDTMPMRFRGISVQLHGNTVTSIKVDRLDTLREHMVRSTITDIISLDQAVNILEDFYYPTTDERAEYQRYLRVYSQWNHQYQEDRLSEIIIDDVALEYVFDELNRRIEPYYVFSGRGIDLAGDNNSIRMYVAATTNEYELRGPYRE